VLNEAASLPTLLGSIDTQTRPPDEVVIVDGGSSDDSLSTLQRWAEVSPARIVCQTPGANIARGRNAAIERSTGEIVVVTDAGVRLDPSWLARLAGTLEANPDVDVACGFFMAESQGVFERALAAATLPAAREIDPTRFLPSSRPVAVRRT